MMRTVSKFWIFHQFEIAENWNFEKTEYCSLAMIDIKPPKLGETKNETGLDSVLDNSSASTRAYGVLFYILMFMLLLKWDNISFQKRLVFAN